MVVVVMGPLIQSILLVKHPFLSAGHFSAAGSEVCEMTL